MHRGNLAFKGLIQFLIFVPGSVYDLYRLCMFENAWQYLQVWATGQRLPERLATTLQPFLDLRFISRLLPGGNVAPGGDDWRRGGQPSEFDIELEVEQEGGGEQQATLLSPWLLELR